MAKSGDVFSIKTSKGNGYFQFTVKNKLMGQLIRVISNVFDEPHLKLCDLVQRETKFWTFLPVDDLFRHGLITRELNCPIPSHAKDFPLFRTGVPHPQTKRVETWWLWDGEKSWPIGELTEEQRRLPIRANWNDTILRTRIEQGWRPELDPR